MPPALYSLLLQLRHCALDPGHPGLVENDRREVGLPTDRTALAQGVAAATHVSGWTLAKVLLVRAPGEGPVMVVLPASCRLDLPALA